MQERLDTDHTLFYCGDGYLENYTANYRRQVEAEHNNGFIENFNIVIGLFFKRSHFENVTCVSQSSGHHAKDLCHFRFL